MNAIIAGALLVLASCFAYADDPEPTVVEWRASGAPFGPFTEWQRATIPPADDLSQATLISDDRSAFRWVRH